MGFSYGQTDDSQELGYLFSSTALFDQISPFIEFSAQVMQLPIVRQPSDLGPYLNSSINAITKTYLGNHFLDSLKTRLRLHVKTGFPTLPEISKKCDMAPASFARKLNGYGTTYSAIKDELRRELATRYLSKSKLSVNDIAAEIGFSEYSSFCRAFKNWYGVTPKSYRQRHSAGDKPH